MEPKSSSKGMGSNINYFVCLDWSGRSKIWKLELLEYEEDVYLKRFGHFI